MKEGRASPTPRAVALGHQRPRCGGARQRRLLCVATATPRSRRSNAQRRRRWAWLPLRRLKVFSQATATLPLRWHAVGSRLSLNVEPGADGRPGGSWPCRRVVSGTAPGSWCCCRQDPATRRGGPGASTKDKPANDRPSPHSVLVHTSTHSPAAPGRKASSCHSGWQAGWLPVADGGGRGPLPFKAKEFVSCYLSI